MPTRKATAEELAAADKKARWDSLPNSLANAGGRMQSNANIGDSMESRTFPDGPGFLGGGIDLNLGLGLMGSWVGQGDGMQYGAGMDGDLRAQYMVGKGNPAQNQSTRMAWSRISMCRMVYENDGQIAAIIDLMADFCIEGVDFVHKKKSVERFFKGWAEYTELRERLRRAVIDMLIAGSVFLYKVYATLTPKEVTTLKNFTEGTKIGNTLMVTASNGKEYEIAPNIQYDSSIGVLFGDKVDVDEEIKKLVIAKMQKDKKGISIKDTIVEATPKRVPWKYISLNPLQMYPNAKGTWSYLLTKDDVEKLIAQLDIQLDASNKSIFVAMPDGVEGNIKKLADKGGKSGFFAEMELDDSRLVTIDYSKFDWAKWAIPMLWKVIPTVMFKNALRAMEMKTAKAGINTVTLWKLGDHKEGLLPDSSHFERLADMLKAPSSTLNILWSSAIEAEVIQPDLAQIFDPKRWEGIRQEITAQFGVTQSLINGEGGNFSSSFISVKGLLQKLQTLRALLVSGWLIKDMRQIVKAMGFRNMPTLEFDNSSLQDEKAEQTFMLNLLDRGFISDETMYKYMNKNSEVERRRILDQNKFEDDNDMVRRGPFMVLEGQTEIVSKQLKSQEKMADDSNALQEKQIKNDKLANDQKIQNDHEIKKIQVKQEGVVNMHMAKKGMHPAQLKAVQPTNNSKVKKAKKANGRPPGSTGPQKNKRTPKPKQTASVDLAKFISQADEAAKQAMIAVEGKSMYKELSKEGKAKVSDLVAYSLAESLYEDGTTLDKLGEVAKGEINFSEDHLQFMQAFGGRAAEFKSREGRKPTKSEVYNMYSDAYRATNEYLNSTED